MTAELTALALAALLQVLQFVLYSVLANMQVGPRYAMGSRDTSRILTGAAGRAQRALNNHFEGLILFGIAVGVVTLSDTANASTALAALIYLVARVLYVPAYMFGLVPWRSVIWGFGLVATVYLLIHALLS
jgi:uncharacterized MAPEG superfamily protein